MAIKKAGISLLQKSCDEFKGIISISDWNLMLFLGLLFRELDLCFIFALQSSCLVKCVVTLLMKKVGVDSC